MNSVGNAQNVTELRATDSVPAVRVTAVTLDGRSLTTPPTITRIDERAIAATWTAGDANEHRWVLTITNSDGTAWYGAGERFNALNQSGYALPMHSDDRFGFKGVGTYKPVPFIMSTRGYGIWVDSYSPDLFDLNATDRFNTHLHVTDKQLRLVVMGGPSPADLLREFTALTGRPRVPPPWAFGLWKSRDVHHNADSVYADVERLKRYGIPASVIVLDSPWETGYNNFEVNRTQFADPEKMFARIHALGFELCVWLTPFINDSSNIDMKGVERVSSNWAEAQPFLVKDSSGNVLRSEWWKGRGALVDFTNPKAVAWWHSQLRKTLAYGVHAFKVDDGEGHYIPNAKWTDGTSAHGMVDRYAMLYDSVMQAYVDNELHGNGVLEVRSGFTGSNRYPFAWAGDNNASFSFEDGLPSVILAGQNAALSGIALWGSDVAGYAGRPDKELFIRWSQFGAFSPFFQVHMTSNLGPWDFDAETLDIFRSFAQLRTSLFPYLYDAVHEAAATGMPIIRPMALAFQDDPVAAQQIYQFMYGPDLLVAPMYQRGTHRSVYLPAGGWYDWWTHVRYNGPRNIEVEAPLNRMPLFVRAGAILPLLPDSVQRIDANDHRRVLMVWPGAHRELKTWDGILARWRGDVLDVTAPAGYTIRQRMAH